MEQSTSLDQSHVRHVRRQPVGFFRTQVRWASRCRAGVKSVNAKPDAGARSLARDCTGAAAIEYAFLVALIALALIMSLNNTAGAVENNWNEVNSAMSDASGMNFNSN